MAIALFCRSQSIGVDTTFNKAMMVTNGSSTSTAVVNSAASGTDIQWTQTAGGNVVTWLSPQVNNNFTISGTVTFSVYAFESNMSANIGMRARLYRYRPSGGGGYTIDEMGGGPWDDGTELGTSASQRSWTGTPTSNNDLQPGDRIGLAFYATNVGNMASGHTATLNYNNTAASSGESKVTFTENLTFYDKDLSTVAFRFYEDDGADGSATAIANVNTGISRNIASPDLRVRLGVKNTGANTGPLDFCLYYSKNGGAWAQVPTSGNSDVNLSASTHFSTGDNLTTQRITSGTFISGEMLESPETSAVLDNNITVGNVSEYEVKVTLSNSLSGGDIIDFLAGSLNNPYISITAQARVTIQAPYQSSYSQNVDVSDAANSNQLFSNTPVSQAITVSSTVTAGLSFTDTLSQAITMGFTNDAGLVYAAALTQAITAGYTTSAIHRLLDSISQNAAVNDVYASIHRTLMDVSQAVDVNDVYAAQHRILEAVSQLVDVSDAFSGGLRLESSVSQSVVMAAVHAAVMRFSQAVPADVNVEDTYAGVVRIAAALAQAIAVAESTSSQLASNNYQVDVSFPITPTMLAAAAHVVRETIIATADVNDTYSILQTLAGVVSQNVVADVAHDGVMVARADVPQSITLASLFNGGSSLTASVSDAVSVNSALVAGMRFSMTMAEAVAIGDPFAANWRTNAEVAQALAVGYAVTSRLVSLAGLTETVNVEELTAGGITLQASLTEALLPVVTYATTAALQAGFQASINVDVFDDFRSNHQMGATVSFPIILTDEESDVGIEYRQNIVLSMTIIDQVISVNLQIETPGWSQEPQGNTWTDPTA